jgi:hypothetical protein
MFIYTPQQIAQTLYFSLRCVDALQGKGMRYVLTQFLGGYVILFSRCVDSSAEAFTGQGLLDELPTDWVKSD